MAVTGTTAGEGRKRGRGVRRSREVGGRYFRYSEQQIEVLEKAYAECSHPKHFQRQQIMRDQPVLRGIDHKQLKVWFQNRRCREKQKKESNDLVLENKQLASANELLRDENDGMLRKLTQLMSENEDLRNQLTSRITTNDFGHQPEANNTQLPISVAENKSLLSLAEEIRKEFLSKAIGTAIDWIPIRWPKLLGPSSVGTIYVSLTCIGVAARACVTIPLEPVKIMEILKDRITWSRRCRSMNVVANHPANNGGTIELIYTQYYSPTLMACARDFWTLRYTSVLDDGCFVICEKSVSGSDAAPSSPAALEFVRGRMLASGYMIRPNGGGSTIHLVDHLDLEASSVPEVVRPLYESSELVAKKMVLSALHYIEHVANEKNGVQVRASREDPAFVRCMSQNVSRGFNHAINCFSEDGWTLMNGDTSDEFIVSVKRTKNYGVFTNFDSVICVKASLLLQNVSPASMVRLLKERRSAWMDFNFTSHSIAFTRAGCVAYPGAGTHKLSEVPVVLGYSNYEDESLEVLRFPCTDRQFDNSMEELHHLQICSGMEDVGFGACSELIFAPIAKTLPNEALLLSSGFRIHLLGSNTGTSSSANLASQTVVNHPTSLVILAFQFPFEAHLLDDVAAMARDYVRHIISSVKSMSVEAKLPASYPEMNSTEANPSMMFYSALESTSAVNLANLMCQSYRSILGVDMPGLNTMSANSMKEQMQNHQFAILCFSLTQGFLTCVYANQAALNMLETTLNNMQKLTVDQMFGGSYNSMLYSVLPTIIQQGYVILPPGHTQSAMSRGIMYAQAVSWKVQSPDGSVHCLAFAFIDWSFT